MYSYTSLPSIYLPLRVKIRNQATLIRQMGFSKSKLASYKPFSYSSHQQFGSSKDGPSSQPNQNGYPRGFTDQSRAVYSSMQKVSFSSAATSNFIERNGYRNPTWSGDENVDEEATNYISRVRQRLRGEW